MRRRAFLSAVATGAGIGVAGCAAMAGPDPSSADYDVGMSSSAFLPVAHETTVGSTVVWKNTSTRAHTVTAYEARIPADAAYFASGGFASEMAAREGYMDGFGGSIYSDERYEHTFRVPGTYHYFCIPHERGGMVGRIVVRE